MKLACIVALLVAVPAAAQTDPVLNKRVGSLESEMRAVQRKVFPGGDAKFFTPEIAPAPTPVPAQVGTPATSAIVDLTTRVDALERQLRTMTGQIEENQFKLRQLEEGQTKLRGDTEFRLNALEAHAPGAAPAPPADQPADQAAAAAPPAPFGDKAPAKAPPAAKAAAATPATVEGQWRAAYALYVAKDYAGAEAAMEAFLAANPKAARASNAQYWLGRSYMAQDSHAQAAKAFLDGYQKMPKGDRAPDSLLWLGNALAALKKPEQACRALNELQSVYGDKLTPALKTQATKARSEAKCDA
ncbi:MAG: YbgF trimerization domain-containing protein [Janthinobacterium lividum]